MYIVVLIESYLMYIDELILLLIRYQLPGLHRIQLLVTLVTSILRTTPKG